MIRNPEYTRKLIIDKALPIFNKKGYNAASISDITNATGITKGAIYGNFKNKDEVAEAAFEYGSELILNQIAQRVKAANDAPSKLISIVDYYSEYTNNPPIPGGCPILNSSIEADDNLPFLRSRVVRTIALIKDSLSKIVTRGIVEKQLKEQVDVEEFVITFYATIQGGIVLSRVEGDGRSYEFAKRSLLRMIDEATS